MSVPTRDVVDGTSIGAPEAASAKVIKGRSLGQIAWSRLKRDKIAMAGGVVIVVLVVMALLAPVLCKLLGVDPYAFHTDLLSALSMPQGKLGGISAAHPLGIEPLNGRDILARILYGARVSLTIAFLATMLGLIIGVVAGITAGYFGGWIDTILSRLMDIIYAFPVLLFSIALLVIVSGIDDLSGGVARIGILVFVIGFFGWPYIGRIIRGQVLSIREKEYVEAARSLGAGSGRILFRELLPNLVAPILVYATLTMPSNILTEAAFSYLGVGVQPPTASWGQMLSDAVNTFEIDPAFMIIPGLAIFITVLSFNLFGDGLRDAFDPRGGR
ncbi:MAG: ABC transporter permease [Actinomycetes bacterium]